MRSLLLDEPRTYLRFLDMPGDGPPLVFLHGMGCASTIDYPRVIANHALAGRRSILLDLLGHGYSDAPKDFDYSVGAHAQTVSTLLDKLSITQATVFGHSAGGAVAIVLASERPDVVRTVICSESNLDPGGGTVSKAIAAQSEEDFVTTGHQAAVQKLLDLGSVSRAATFRATDPVAFHRTACSLVEGSNPTWREMLYGLRIPRAWLTGDADDPQEDIEAMGAQDIPVFVVEGGDHDMAFGKPDGVAAAIAAALAHG